MDRLHSVCIITNECLSLAQLQPIMLWWNDVSTVPPTHPPPPKKIANGI